MPGGRLQEKVVVAVLVLLKSDPMDAPSVIDHAYAVIVAGAMALLPLLSSSTLASCTHVYGPLATA